MVIIEAEQDIGSGVGNHRYGIKFWLSYYFPFLIVLDFSGL